MCYLLDYWLFADPMDYVALTEDLTFGPQSNVQTVVLLIENDGVTEGLEAFFGRLVAQTSLAGLTISPDIANITIFDNDSELKSYILILNACTSL